MEELAKSMNLDFSIWKNVCLEFLKAYQDQSINKMISLCKDDSTVSFLPLGKQGEGKVHELGQTMWTLLIECFPDIDNTVHTVLAEDGNIVAKVSIRGTQTKDFAGIPNKNLSFDSEHIFVFTLDGSHQIKHVNISWDHEDFQNQLSS